MSDVPTSARIEDKLKGDQKPPYPFDEIWESLRPTSLMHTVIGSEIWQTGNLDKPDVKSHFRKTLLSILNGLTQDWANWDVPPAKIEDQLHYAWFLFFQAMKRLHWEDEYTASITQVLVQAKALGCLERPSPPQSTTSSGTVAIVNVNEIVGAAGGSSILDQGRFLAGGRKLWVGLPFFAEDLVYEWTYHYYGNTEYDREQRENAGAGISRLISVGIYPGTTACFLSLMRETLEVRRPLETNNKVVSDDASSVSCADGSSTDSSPILAMDELVPILQSAILGLDSFGLRMLRFRYHLIQCENTDVPQGLSANAILNIKRLSSLGELAVESGTVVSSGYSAERWLFWLRRLQELESCSVRAVEQSARRCVNMLLIIQDGSRERPTEEEELWEWVIERNAEKYDEDEEEEWRLEDLKVKAKDKAEDKAEDKTVDKEENKEEQEQQSASAE